MERAYRCRFNQYGCRRCRTSPGSAATAICVFSDMVQLESVADPSGDRLLVTPLTDRVMPSSAMRSVTVGASSRRVPLWAGVSADADGPVPQITTWYAQLMAGVSYLAFFNRLM